MGFPKPWEEINIPYPTYKKARGCFDTFVPYKAVSSVSPSCTNPSSLSLSSCAAVAPPGWRLVVSVWIQLPLARVIPSSLPWLQVLLTSKPLSGFAEWFIAALPCWPCSSLVEFLWTSPIFWPRASTPSHFQTSDFSNNLSILRPVSLVKSLCKHKP